VTVGKRRVLAERRRVVGYTQEQLAAVLGVERTTVVRWEAGETTPQPWYRPKLAKALAVPVDEVDTMLAEGQVVEQRRSRSSSKPQANGQLRDVDAADELPDAPEHDPVLTAPWNHRGTVDAVVMLSGGDWVKRRAFLSLTGTALTAPAHQWLVHEPGPLVSGLSGRRVAGGLVDRLTAMIVELRKMDDVVGGGSVLSLAQHEFSWVADLLDHAVYNERTGRALHAAIAELGQLCGWLAYDAGYFGLAQHYYTAALRAAHSADNRPFGAHILTFMAHQAARQGQPAEAVTFIETALAGTRGQATPALLAQLYSQQAYAFAALHDTSACTAAISQARTQVEQLKLEDDLPWLYWMSSSLVTVRSGDCLLKLGQAEQAAAMLNEGIVEFSESFVRDRQIYMTYLADALARPGKQRDLDAAARLGMESIDLAESLDSNRGIDLLRDLCHQMTPHAKVPAVGDFLERARGLVTV
jgi:DNA-binding XRE family transcriptional regulator